MENAAERSRTGGPLSNTWSESIKPLARGRSWSRGGNQRSLSPKPVPDLHHKPLDPEIKNSVHRIKALTSKLEARSNSFKSDIDQVSNKRTLESSSSISSINSSKNSKSPIWVYRPRKQFQGPLLSSSPNASIGLDPNLLIDHQS